MNTQIIHIAVKGASQLKCGTSILVVRVQDFLLLTYVNECLKCRTNIRLFLQRYTLLYNIHSITSGRSHPRSVKKA